MDCQEFKAPKKVDHFLLYCRKYNLERANLLQQLTKNNVFGLNMKILIGGRAQHYDKIR